jgi:hypothetical protein
VLHSRPGVLRAPLGKDLAMTTKSHCTSAIAAASCALAALLLADINACTSSSPPGGPGSGSSSGTSTGSSSGSGSGSSSGSSSGGASGSSNGAPIDGGAVDASAESSAADGATGDVGSPDASAADAVVCGNDLSNVGTGDFTISLTLTTTAMNSAGRVGTGPFSHIGTTAVINQRSTCNPSAPFWDIRAGLPPTGSPANAFWIDIETDDTTADDSTANMVVLNDGVPHIVVLTRISGTMRISVDGVAGTPVPSTSNFGALPPLATGNDVCDGVDGTVPLVGTVTNVCISH